MGASLAGFGDWDANGRHDIVMGGLHFAIDDGCPDVPQPYPGGRTKAWISFGPQSCLCATPPCGFCDEPDSDLVRLIEASGAQSRLGHDVCFVGYLYPQAELGQQIAISAPTRTNALPGGGVAAEAGTVYVLFLENKATLEGGTGPFDPEVGIPGVRVTAIRCPIANAWFGLSITSCGNVIGDSTPDLLIGAPDEGDLDTQPGRAFVVDGRRIRELAGSANSAPGVLWVDADNSKPLCVGAYDPQCQGASCCAATTGNSRVIVGTFRSRLGYGVSGLGDLNQDGYNEIALGAPEIFQNCAPDPLPGGTTPPSGMYPTGPGLRGFVQVAGWTNGGLAANSTATTYAKITGRAEDDLPNGPESSFFGRALSGFGAMPASPQGDVVGDDGVPDLLIGAPLADRPNSQGDIKDVGAAYVVSGAMIRDAGALYGGTVAIQTIAAQVKLGVYPEEAFGWSVAGKLNSDYVPEFAIGSRSFEDRNCPTCLPSSVPSCYCSPPANPPVGSVDYDGFKLGRATIFCGSTFSPIVEYVGEQFRERLGYDIAWLGHLYADGGSWSFTELGAGGVGWATYCLDSTTCIPETTACRAEQGRVYVFMHQEAP